MTHLNRDLIRKLLLILNLTVTLDFEPVGTRAWFNIGSISHENT